MSKTDSLPLLRPDWPAPQNVMAYSTTREGGFSQGRYASLNLGLHVGDDAQSVINNRRLLPAAEQIVWLNQVHGNTVAELPSCTALQHSADASYTMQPNVGCAVMTADCLPLLVCHKWAEAVAAVHCGWRGLASGIIYNTFRALPGEPRDYLVWLGPAIGPHAFEVGEEVVDSFPSQQGAFIQSTREGKYMANIFALASQQIKNLGVTDIFANGSCTLSDAEQFFSYRRDGQTGRMASVIFITQ